MTEPLTKRERKLKRKLRKTEGLFTEVITGYPQVVVNGQFGVFVPLSVYQQPGGRPPLLVVRPPS